MNLVIEVLEGLRATFTRDPECVVLTGHAYQATALADVTEYVCHCIFNCAERGSVLAMRLHALWGEAISRFYATKEIGASYSTAILYTEHALRELVVQVRTFPSDIDRARSPLLLEEAVHAFIQMHTPSSRTGLEELLKKVKDCS